LESFTEYLNKLIAHKNNLLVYCISYPINKINEENKKIMREILEPNHEIKKNVNQILVSLSLSHKEYISIHIRSGDNYLNDKENTTFRKKYIVTLIDEIKKVSKHEKNKNYLLICDNNNIKEIILKSLQSENIKIKSQFKEIVHTSLLSSEDKTLLLTNTLEDFYLLSFSQMIYAFSSYKHGSGFSYWCAKTFNVPYSCKYIEGKIS
jgi:hypothetical protein